MKYLFFDCECANCYNHEGKICSFGYVTTDTNFKILEEKDIIINPDAPFDPHVLGVGQNSIDLAYTPKRFQYAPKFDHFYPDIARLLCDPDTKVFGYAIENDIGFLVSECRRYHTSIPQFTYFDIQDIYRLYREWDRTPSLEDALKDLGVPNDEYAEHQSSDDAKMSMLLLHKMLFDTGLGLDELVAAYPTCKDDVVMFLLQEKANQRPTRDLGLPYNPDFRDQIRSFNELTGFLANDAVDQRFEGQRFLFSPLVKQDIGTALRLANRVLDHSGVMVRYLKETTLYVVYDEMEKREKAEGFQKTSIRLLTLQELEEWAK